MLGPTDKQPRLNVEDWAAVDDLAHIHRLQPHLHGRLMRGELTAEPPPSIMTNWAQAHRSSAISALTHRAELFALTRLLSEHGVVSIALKGAWLAWYAYSAAAERPVRDLDILVPADQADEAFLLLLTNEYELEAGSEDYDEGHRHKPPLLAKSGVRIELHSALKDDSTLAFESTVISNRVRGSSADDPSSYPAADDMLLHLILHAVYGEISLDVGPLMLCDVDYLLDITTVDWPHFWRRCEELEITRGAALVLTITDRWRREGLVERSALPATVPETILQAAPDLLLQDPSARKSASLIASLSGRPIPPAKRILARLTNAKSGGYAKWLSARLDQSLRQITSSDVRQTGAALGELGAWLESAE